MYIQWQIQGGSRGAKEPPFSVASLVHRVEAAVAHCVVVNYCGCCKMCSGRRPPLRWVFQLRGVNQRNAEWTCGRGVQSVDAVVADGFALTGG